MVDYFALALSHGLLALAAWHLLSRRDLDEDTVQPEPETAEPVEPSAIKPGLRLRA